MLVHRSNTGVGFMLAWVGIWLVVAVVAMTGWVMNIFKLIEVINDPISGMFVMRAIGIVAAPLGAVLGFL